MRFNKYLSNVYIPQSTTSIRHVAYVLQLQWASFFKIHRDCVISGKYEYHDRPYEYNTSNLNTLQLETQSQVGKYREIKQRKGYEIAKQMIVTVYQLTIFSRPIV